MQLDKLPSTVKKSKKRLGRGYGSGKGGHTVGRGTKGDLARGNVTDWFEGGQLPQIRRFPFIRGKSRFKPLHRSRFTLNVSELNKLKAKTVVTYKTLVEAKLIPTTKKPVSLVKILGKGKLTVPLTVTLPVTSLAQHKIEAAGGKVDRGATA